MNDPQEQEADAIADRVMRTSDPVAIRNAPTPPALRRKCAPCAAKEETTVRRKRAACEAEEETLTRTAASAGAVSPVMEAPASVHAALATPGRPMDAPTRAFFEPRFGRDLGYVRLHTESAAAASAHDVGALAYTVGSHIVLGSGGQEVASSSGRQLIAHELAHVLQNDTPGAQPTLRRTTHVAPTTPTNCHNWKIPLPPWIAGTIAHGQISSTLKIPPHSIPRATKSLKGTPTPPATTPRGFADLFAHGPISEIAEIKSTATGGVVAADEARHYIQRHDEWLARMTGGTADSLDADYLAWVGGLVPGGPLNLGAITGLDLALGPFWGDPAKQLHIEGDALGAVVYWCTGTGISVSPLWLIALKKALDALAKKLKEMKEKLATAAAKIAAALGALARAIRSTLLPLFVTLLVLAIVALFVVAIICVLAAPETGGLSLACSALGLAGAVTATAALLLLVGMPSSPTLPTATASVFRASNPDIAMAEPESGSDYERDSDTNAAASITSPETAKTTVAAFNPGDDFLAAVSPIVDTLGDPIAFAGSLPDHLGSLDDRAVGRLTDAATALEAMGDTVTATFIRSTIANSGLNRPGALATTDTAPADENPAPPTAAA